MKTALVSGLIVIGSIAGTYLFQPTDELQQAETRLEQTTGAKLKDTWPAFRDSLCKGMIGSELNDCRIYQTQLFETQVRLYKESSKMP